MGVKLWGKQSRPDANFTVLMLGQRRTGKSSVLASMITSMADVCSKTGLQFTADNATNEMIKQSQINLKKIFEVYLGEDEFCPQDGVYQEQHFGKATSADITYRFFLELATPDKRGKRPKPFIIDFIDIRGESIAEQDSGLTEKIATCDVLMIAIDSPALMEGTIQYKHTQNGEAPDTIGVGQYHEQVNMPKLIYQCIQDADSWMRIPKNKTKKRQHLVLFVPLKCEKYYYEQQMNHLLLPRLKLGYENLFNFLAGYKEYTVAITPILTLGNVIFSRYKNGLCYGDIDAENVPKSLRAVPKFPMFSFRESFCNGVVRRPEFSPLYCEQPLLYLIAFINSIVNKATAGDKAKKVIKDAVMTYLFGVFYVGWRLAVHTLTSSPELLEAFQKATLEMKIQENGYEIVYDHIGLKKWKEKVS